MNVDNETLVRLTRNPLLRNKFSFIRFADRQLKANNKKACCGKTRNYKSPNEVLEIVKQSILGLPEAGIQEFKKALGADEITVLVKTRTGELRVFTR